MNKSSKDPIHITSPEECVGCTACFAICPKQCIQMKADHEGFLYPVVDESICIRCGRCTQVCPVIHPKESQSPQQVWGGYNMDEEIRRESSSGGIFSQLAIDVLARGGVVFGAVINGQMLVEHTYIEKQEELVRLRGSKYIQSRVGESFKQVKTFLQSGREVLFSGTPCQIAGLNFFLGKKYDNLFLVDVICHGAPSPKVFDNYKKETFKHNQLEHISFRDKIRGWKRFSIATRMSGKIKYEGMMKNPFMRGFLYDLYLRPSCHACPVKGGRSGADITLADFWGIDRLRPDLDDDKGYSVLLVHTSKYEKISTHSGLRLVAFSEGEALRGNLSYYHSVAPHPKREQFFRQMDLGLPIVPLIQKYTGIPKHIKAFRKLKSYIKKCMIWR